MHGANAFPPLHASTSKARPSLHGGLSTAARIQHKVRARKRDRHATQNEQCDLLLKASERGTSVARVSRRAKVRSAAHGADMALNINKCATACER